MDNLLSEYTALYQQAQVLVFFLGFFVCLCLILIGLLFQRDKRRDGEVPEMSEPVRKWMRRLDREEM